MERYSGTYIAAATMFVVPALVNIGFSEFCANEIVTIGVPAVLAAVLMFWRWTRGGVTAGGKRI